MKGPLRIAVLMTCHNRREKTLACLESLHGQAGRGETFELLVHLVDAGSTDGTAPAVRAAYPDAVVLEADTSTYWGTGTAMAARSAAQDGADYHLWLNDDVVLRPDALNRLVRTAERQGLEAHIVIGQLCDASGAPSYGGFRRGRRPLSFDPVGVTEDDVACDTMNGNVVLISASAAGRLGPVDDAFPHAMGDIDYGLRATAAGIPVAQAGGVHGECDRNPPPRSAQSRSRLERLRGVIDIKRLPPRAWWTFCRRYSGSLALAYFVKPYAHTLVVACRSERSVPDEAGSSCMDEPRRWRVVHVLNELRASGAEMMLLSDATADAGLVDGIIATGASVGPLASAFSDAGVDVVHLPFRPTVGWIVKFLAAIRQARVVHVHVERASFWIAMLARSSGRAVVRSLHSVFPFEGYLRCKRAFQRRAMAAAGVTFVAVSNEVAVNEQRRFGTTPVTILNSPDDRFFDIGHEREYRPTVKTLMTVGNCEPRKNHAELLQAVHDLNCNGADLRYIHVGAGSPHEDIEREFCKQHDLNEAVSFVGQVDPSEFLPSADVLVMPSLREGLSIAVLEGIASGITVLLSDTPGMRELKSISGLWWSKPNAHALAEGIRRIASTPPAELEWRAQQARRTAIDKFSPSRRRALMRKVYEQSSCGNGRKSIRVNALRSGH